jgi:hypothetical protein
LLEAAAHLVAAGKHDDATRLRAEAAEAKQRLLTAKLAELANLQAEVDLLRAAHPELAVPDEGESADWLPNPDTVARQAEGKDNDAELLMLVRPSVVERAPELNTEFIVERAYYASPAAPSSRRQAHPPRPFSAPSYQTMIRR